MRRFDLASPMGRLGLALATAVAFPIAVVSTGVTLALVDSGSLLAALTLPVAIVSSAVVGLGVRHAVRRNQPVP